MIALPANRATRFGLNFVILLGVVVALKLGQSVFIPLIIAMLLAAVLGPAALWLHQRLKIRWTLACLTTIFGLVIFNLLVMGVFFIAVPKFMSIMPRSPERTSEEERQQAIYTAISDKIKNIAEIFGLELGPDVLPEKAENSTVFLYFRDTVQKVVPEALIQISLYGCNWLWQWILIIFILFFLLLEGSMLSRRVVEIFGPSEEIQTKARAVLHDMASQVKTYLVWRTIINFGLAVVVGTIYHLAGLHQAWTWAMLLAILNYIPYLGPILAGIPPLIDSLISVSPSGAVVILVLYTGVIILEGYLIVPLLMGRSMDLNATTVLMACLFWDLVWGSMGLFLAMPLMAAMKAICYHVPGWRPWANLMSTGEEEPQPVFLQPAPADVRDQEVAENIQPLPAPASPENPAPEPVLPATTVNPLSISPTANPVPVTMDGQPLRGNKSPLGPIAFILGATVMFLLIVVFKLL